MTEGWRKRSSEGRNSIQRHIREHLSKIKNYDELEEELYAELYRREADVDKPGSFNQLGGPEEKNEDEKEKGEEWPEQTWQDVWSPSTAGFRRFTLSRPNGPGKATTRPRRIPKFPAPTKAKARPKEKVERKEYVGNAALTIIIKPTVRKAKAGKVATAEVRAPIQFPRR